MISFKQQITGYTRQQSRSKVENWNLKDTGGQRRINVVHSFPYFED